MVLSFRHHQQSMYTLMAPSRPILTQLHHGQCSLTHAREEIPKAAQYFRPNDIVGSSVWSINQLHTRHLSC